MAKTKRAAELTEGEAPETAVAVVAAPVERCLRCRVALQPRGDGTFFCPSCFRVGDAAKFGQ